MIHSNGVMSPAMDNALQMFFSFFFPIYETFRDGGNLILTSKCLVFSNLGDFLTTIQSEANHIDGLDHGAIV